MVLIDPLRYLLSVGIEPGPEDIKASMRPGARNTGAFDRCSERFGAPVLKLKEAKALLEALN